MTIALHGQGVLVRPFEHHDVPAFAEAARESSASVGIWMPWCHDTYSEAEAQAWIDACIENVRSNSAYDLGIFSSDGKDLYGGIAINQISTRHNFGVVGYWVRTTRQRRGIATQAVKLIAAFGLGELQLTRLEIVIALANHASQGVAERAGATYEGIARNRLLIRGRPLDAAVYSFTPAAGPGQAS